MRRHGTLFVMILVMGGGVFLLGGCPKKPTGTIMESIPGGPDYDRPLPGGQLALRKITDLRQMPDFTPACRNVGGLKLAIANSLHYLAKPSSKRFFPYDDITHERAVASLQAFEALLDSGKTPEQLNAAIRSQFDVYTSVGWDGSGVVWFTGYYTPIFNGSMTRTDRFRYPLYKEPPNLAKTADGTVLGLRGADGTIRPCGTRKELEQSGALAGTELVYLGDPFEVYIAHVQGSARVRLPDGRMITVGYAANNGLDYVSVGKELVKDGKIAKENLSLQAMIDYFRAHPQEVTEYTWRNPRFVFFALNEGAPHGSLNEPVTPLRTVATDKAIFPRAAMAMAATNLPQRTGGFIQSRPYWGFALDQDTGGGIRAAGRCDIYMGIGDEAGKLAGRTQQEGRLYYLFLKPAGAGGPALPKVSPPPLPPEPQ